MVLGTPVSVTGTIITSWVDHLTDQGMNSDQSPVFTDVGSTKQELCQQLKQPWEIGHLVGSHPMCGSHLSGIDHADSQLYQDATVVICQHTQATHPRMNLVAQLWQQVGANVTSMTPSEHDLAVAEASHLPHILSALTAKSLSPTSMPLAASGFRDTSRVAAGSPELWRDILMANKQAITSCLASCQRELKHLEELLAEGNHQEIEIWLRLGKERRAEFGSWGARGEGGERMNMFATFP